MAEVHAHNVHEMDLFFNRGTSFYKRTLSYFWSCKTRLLLLILWHITYFYCMFRMMYLPLSFSEWHDSHLQDA
jgi:hypothetical protein